MKFKYISLLTIIIFISGCKAEVDLEINKNNINENIEIIFYENNLYPKEAINTSFRNYIPIYASDVIVDTEEDIPFPNIKYYDKTKKELNNGYIFNYKYNFTFDEYQNARTVKNGFKSYRISKDIINQTISLSTSAEKLIYFEDYPLLEEVKVNIKTNYVVKENNADVINNNTYTWILKKDSNKNINMLIDTSKTNNKIIGINVNDNIFVIIIILIILSFILFFLYLKNKHNNKI